MLLKPSLKPHDVIILKLTSGTEIVARLVLSDHDGSVTITRPLVAQPVQQEGGIGLAFMPFSLTARDDEEFLFTADKLLLNPYRAREEVVATYTANTSSIALPPTPQFKL